MDQNVDLLRAAKNGNASTVSKALERGGRADVIDEAESTPLMLAAGLGHLEVVQVLLQAGAEVDAADSSG